MAVTLIRKTFASTAEWSVGRRRYTIRYRATVSSGLDGPVTILNNGSAPKLFQTTYQYGNDADTGAVCVNVSTPKRSGAGKQDWYWDFEAEFVYDRANIPSHNPVKIEPFYIQGQAPVTRATFVGFFKYTGSNSNWVETSVAGSPLVKNSSRGVITNSALTPILPAPERRVATPAYRVTWTKRTAFDYTPYINTVNNSLITLSAPDKVVGPPAFEFSGAQQTIFSKQFPANTLLLADVQSTIVQIYDQNWYQYTLELHEDDHIHYELDRGLAEYSGSGEEDGRGGTFNTGDFPDGVPKQRIIKDPSGHEITDPVLFNGAGKVMPVQDPKEAIYLGWQKYFTSDFTELQIGVYD